jgi:hypothetical protein
MKLSIIAECHCADWQILFIVMLSVIMLNVVMLNAVMQNVMAPEQLPLHPKIMGLSPVPPLGLMERERER